LPPAWENAGMDADQPWKTVLDAVVASQDVLATAFARLEGKVDAGFASLGYRVGNLEADVGTLKADVGTLKADVGTLKADVREIRGDIERIDRRLVRIDDRLSVVESKAL
jgi:outer membrane murein-binding lipoprotein Lpp